MVGTGGIQCRGLRQPVVNVATGTHVVQPLSDSGTVFSNKDCSGSATIHLPPAAPGLSFSFIRASPFALLLQAATGDAIRGSAAGRTLTLASDDASVVLLALSAGAWEIVSERGTVH